MDSFSEVRRVRQAMSETAGHDIRKLAAMINANRAQVAERIVNPGAQDEVSDSQGVVDHEVSNREPMTAAGWPSLKEMLLSRGSFGEFWSGMGVLVRSLSGQGRIGVDRLCGDWVGAAVRRVIGGGWGERMAIGGRAMGSCESEWVAAFLSLTAAASRDIPS